MSKAGNTDSSWVPVGFQTGSCRRWVIDAAWVAVPFSTGILVAAPLLSRTTVQVENSALHGQQLLWLFTMPCVLLCAVVLLQFFLLKRASSRARRKAGKRIHDTDTLTDDLLQGVQGLVLTFHVAAQNLSEEHASKKMLDHALSEADALLTNGRKRFECVAFQAHEPSGTLSSRAPGRGRLWTSTHLKGIHGKGHSSHTGKSL